MNGAQKNRRDVQIVEYFKSEGVPETQIAYLRDGEASLKRITSTFHHPLAKADPDDLLVFYYTGHGFRDHKKRQVHFANYDATDGATAWSVASIVDTIEQKFAGQRALLMADCCFSGGLADEALRRGSWVGYGCLCGVYRAAEGCLRRYRGIRQAAQAGGRQGRPRRPRGRAPFGQVEQRLVPRADY